MYLSLITVRDIFPPVITFGSGPQTRFILFVRSKGAIHCVSLCHGLIFILQTHIFSLAVLLSEHESGRRLVTLLSVLSLRSTIISSMPHNNISLGRCAAILLYVINILIINTSTNININTNISTNINISNLMAANRLQEAALLNKATEILPKRNPHR